MAKSSRTILARITACASRITTARKLDQYQFRCIELPTARIMDCSHAVPLSKVRPLANSLARLLRVRVDREREREREIKLHRFSFFEYIYIKERKEEEEKEEEKKPSLTSKNSPRSGKQGCHDRPNRPRSLPNLAREIRQLHTICKPLLRTQQPIRTLRMARQAKNRPRQQRRRSR